MDEKQHTYRINNNYKDTLLTETSSQVYNLSLSQNQRIYLMLRSLKDSSFLNKIGRIINEDVEDIYSEHGGIITISPKLKLKLNILESENAKDKIKENNKFYLLPRWAYNLPSIAKFHLHATSYQEYKFAGPGKQDIIIARSEIDLNEASHEFIITSIEKGKFNMDYLGGDRLLDKQPKVIDLGNYKYDTTKIINF